MTDKQLVTFQEERTTAAALYGNDQDIAAFGYAVKKVAPWAQGMQDHDIGLVVRRALAMGLDPLNPYEVQVWPDGKGRVQFQLAYTLVVEWVRHFHGEHTEPQYHELTEADKDREGLPHDTMAFQVSFIMKSDLGLLDSLIRSGFTPQEAREMVTVTGLGVATFKEHSNPYFAAAGRSPAWKVRKRALTDAYRSKFGTPTREQIVELRRLGLAKDVEPEDWIVSGGDPRIAETEAVGRTIKAEMAELAPDEVQEILDHNGSLLHGEFSEDAESTTRDVEATAAHVQGGDKPKQETLI